MIVNRVLIYVTLTATLVLVYVGSVSPLQSVFRVATGYDSQLAVVLSTLAALALFNPLRRCIQMLINRRFHQQES